MTVFIQLKDGEPIGYPVLEDNLRALFPEVDFPKAFTPGDVEPYGFGMFEFTQVPEAPHFHKAVDDVPVKGEDGIYYQRWKIVEMSPEEKQDVTNRRIQDVKNLRFHYLITCDWTQLPNAPITDEKKQQWEIYRQALRDITTQENYPWNITWPDTPQ